ncbi:hypothetical protein [Bradyrhizobium japonicum]|uniref:hypothetical protein n=1 Tax=Bradyrhizobium japonicum TaxID=375 RepID=UPI0006879216|nr:hypothetical protein [Bradyrhizobium japonicum]WLB91325.1 hypothetical protein QIH91_13435 [Bradyrhizobium japonicum USDA 135]
MRLSPTAAALYHKIGAATSSDDLADLLNAIWRRHWPSELSDKEAESLTEAIESRKHKRAMSAANSGFALNSRLVSRFKSRQRQRSPDRQASRDRRRRLGGSSALPDTLRHLYTEGQRAVLCVIAGEIKHHGICDLPIDGIAARAGVCRTTVQTTLHEARRLGHLKITERPVRGQKSLTNLIHVVSKEWRTWMDRGPSAHRPIGSKSVKMVSATKSIDLRKQELCNGLSSGRAGRPPTDAVPNRNGIDLKLLR